MTAKPRRKTSQAPKGRNISAQGNALGNAIPADQSPEGAGHHSDLLVRVLNERRAKWKGRGRYKEPVAAETANLPDLPEGWVWASLDQLFLNITDGDHLPPPQTSSGVPFVVIGDVRNGKLDLSDTRFVAREYADAVDAFRKPRKGDILYTLVGSFGLAIRVTTDDEFCIQRHMAVLRPHSLSPADYLAHILNSPTVFRHASSVATGTAQKTVPLAGLRRIPVPLPPLDDQRRIVAEIEKQFTRLEAGVAALRRVQANLKRYRAAVLKAACEGRLVPTEAGLARAEGRPFESGQQLLARILTERRQNWLAQRSLGKGGQGRGKYKEPDSADAEGLPTLPEGWAWATMPQLGDLGRGKSKHRPRDDSRLYGGPYPFIQTGDVRKSGGTIRQHSQTYSEFGLNQSKLWPVGTLCITIAANIAETGILTFDACFPDSVVGFVHRNTVTTRFVEFFIRTAKEKLEQFAPATAQKNINLDVLQNVAIPLPPLAEQTRIVAEVERRLSVVEELEALVTTNLQRATRLRQSILHKAFTGELS